MDHQPNKGCHILHDLRFIDLLGLLVNDTLVYKMLILLGNSVISKEPVLT